MKQNFRTKELDENGKEKETSERREVILKDIIKVALLNQSQTDVIDNEKGRINKKVINLRYQLWKKIRDVENINFDKKEKKLLMKLIYQHYELLIAGQAIEILYNN
ncbi:MAG: hypothetical protein V1779_17700 [bacterium]